MKVLGIVVGGGGAAPVVCSSSVRNHRFRVSFSSPLSPGSKTVEQVGIAAAKPEYKPGVFDDLFLNLFRSKLVQEVGWDSKKPGYDGLIEVANLLMKKGTTNSDTVETTVRILRSLFPPYLLELYKMLIAPIGGGKIAAMMVGVGLRSSRSYPGGLMRGGVCLQRHSNAQVSARRNKCGS
ncbi:uncharacterized protein LOC109792982 isoform X1 [Cajanus cajan]|uniref:uncharacterized protein LOC109792982 isoform X1 n=1 Tax=Cajanus cajan TaxID=3821 RepID=UPI0010FAE7EE|nr:uncharacterized protein LOC109792982 isoform X1 [Cajanus cajan]